jgi:hypothetical protein
MKSLKASFEIGIVNFLESALPINRTAPLPVAATPTNKASTNTTTLLLRRGAYANPCMAILSMYNAYIVLQQFAITSTPNIIWLDGHAQGDLDGVWEDLFDTKPIHVKQLGANNNETNITRIDDAIVVNTVSAIGNEGLLKYRWRQASANITSDCRMDQTNTLVSFRSFVLEKYNMTRRHQIDDTKNNTGPRQLTFLVRENYRAHPRSNGRTDRVLVNATDDIEYIHSEYPSYNVTTVSFEAMSFREQLSYVTQSDIFLSIHGAGNIHAVFLPDHATFVEYFPPKYQHRKRFRYLSECLNLTYIRKSVFVVETFEKNKVSLRLREASSKNMSSMA